MKAWQGMSRPLAPVGVSQDSEDGDSGALHVALMGMGEEEEN